MKELPYSFQASMALGWAFAWRNAVLVAFITLIQKVLVPEPGLSSTLVLLVLFVGCNFVAAHWLRVRGFGSVKIILVEWAEYQQSQNAGSAQQGIQPDGPASGGSAS